MPERASMFDRIRKAILGEGRREPQARPSQGGAVPASEWDTLRGQPQAAGASALAQEGKVQGRPWRLEVGRPSRRYIGGEEVRARAELGLADDVAAMVINRPLKDRLERQAYSMFTDSLQTTADPNLPEEMRWLAMYDEVGWEALPDAFWRRYAILADRREHAIAWMDTVLAERLMAWPAPAPGDEVPFMLVLLRGKCYLRMQHEPANAATVQHALAVFTHACECAIGAFGDGR